MRNWWQQKASLSLPSIRLPTYAAVYPPLFPSEYSPGGLRIRALQSVYSLASRRGDLVYIIIIKNILVIYMNS